MRTRRGRPGRAAWTRRIAALVGFTLIPGLITPVAFAAHTDPLGKPQIKLHPDKVSPFTAKVNKRTAAVVKKSAAEGRAAIARAKKDRAKVVSWPTAGQAQLTLPVAGSAKASPGSLPLTLDRPHQAKGKKQPKVAGSVKVKVLDQKQTAKLGVKGIVLSVTGPVTGGNAQLGISYDRFASAYGGDWAGRLQALRLPDCALNDPQKAACRTRTPLEFTNDRKHNRIDAQLTFGTAPAAEPAAKAEGRTMMVALAAGTKSGGGDYKATPLAASSTWEAGGSSGTFTWSYPLRTPPAAAGPAPDLSISYDSGAVDGQTANTNNQGTAIGTGFDITSSYVERKYGVCDDDGQSDKFDLCWKYDNASIVLNGKSSELVKDDTSGVWRLKNDDASTVTHSTGADNGDDGDAGIDGKGEYWTVTTGDGTKYVFGLNKLDGAGASDRTDSVWTVPVFGDDSGEPGYAGGTSFSGRAKKQAWRWNLDYVEDTHKNAMSYWYTAETNNYDQLGDDNTGTPYTRGGYLKEIRYGQRADGDGLFAAQPASNKVTFTYAERCDASGTGCDSLTEDTRDNWPDVPFDAVCKDGDKCTGSVSPSFFTRKRMTGVTTYAWDAAATTPGFFAVDNWALKQHYVDPGDTGDSSDQSLWLDEIKHTGKRGTDLALDPVSFTPESHPNRVDSTSDDILSLEKPRLKTVTSETGAQTAVTYMDAGCVAGQTMPRPDENTGRCYPVYWSPNGEKTPILDWFQKYPVYSVITTDLHGGSEAVENTYSYAGGGAWHYNDDPLTKEKERTWSIWRGFGRVTHLTGVPGKTQSKTVTVYMRGMNGDRVLKDDGKTLDPDKRKTATVTGIKAAEITDSGPYPGFTRESVTYNGANEVGGTINDPWSKKTATQHKSYADTEAYYVRTTATHARTNITSSGTPKDRVRSTVTTFDDYGMPETVEDKGDDAITGDEKCTRTWYARNDTLGINSLAGRTRIVAKPCSVADSALDLPAASTSPGDVISDVATAYDTTTWSATQKPTKGEVQWTGRAKSYGLDDAPAFQKLVTTTYDVLGRPLTVKDTNDALVTTAAYTPSGKIGPLTSSTSTNIKGYTTTTDVDFATGAATKVTDPNNKITESEYDSLGRVTKVWLPNRLKLLNATPNYVYNYRVTATDTPWVSTGTLKGDASGYNTTYQIYDSMLRPRQTQTPASNGGTLIAETLYDERGLAVTTLADIWDETRVPSGTLLGTEGGTAPMENDTTYDGAGRATLSVTKVKGVQRFTPVTTTYTGDSVSTSAPTGGQAIMVTTNALGQTTERREYSGPQPTGSDYTTTGYEYTPAGQQKVVTGPDQTKWSYTYDLFGRQDSATDPDKGTTHTYYNALDQVTSTSNSRGKTLISEYDNLGRQIGLWDGTKSDATQLAAWTFDTKAKGQQDTATRYDGGLNGKAYTTKVTGYDALYQVTSSQLILPDQDKEPLVAAGVPSTLSFTTVYNLDGTIKQASQPAVAGLAAETVSNKYNALGQQTQAGGTTAYLQAATYSPQGDLRRLALGTDPTSSAKNAYLNYDYEDGTRRLTRSYVTDDVHGYMPQELKFTQDDAGNVTSIFDASTQGGTTKADYQCFTYDGNRRLDHAWTPKTADCATSGRTTANLDGAAPYWTSYTYNKSGQRETEKQHAASGDTTTNYAYGTTRGQPHPLTTTTGPKTSTYDYDETGNTTSRPGTQAQQTLVWNSEGKLVSTSEPAAGSKPKLETNYLYDASGELLIRRAVGDGDTVLYLGGAEVRLTTKGTTKTLSGTRYYTAAGQTIAVRTATSGVSGTKLNFLCSDPHGTATLVLEPTTWAVTKRYTTPFGATRGTTPTTWPDDKAFLGKPADTTTGLTHIGAREYDPGIGQFLSVDPVLALDQHQSLNGYSYANNTPVTASDPTGLAADGKCGGVGRCPEPGSDNCYAGNMSASCDGIGGNTMGTGGGGGGGSVGGSSGTASGGGSGSGGKHCGFWSKCGWSNAWGDTKDWMQDHKEIVAAVTETVVGVGCVASSIGAVPATGGASLAVTAGCGAIAGAAGAAVTNALSEDADHSTAGAASDMVDGAAWGAASAVVTTAIAGKILSKVMGACHSFLPGTGVLLADGTHKAIEDVEVGDTVTTTDAATGKSVKKKVISTITTEDDKNFTEVTIATGDTLSSIVATDTHPFWVPELKKWIRAGDLQVGQWLRTSAGTHVQITALSHYTKRQRTHDLTIQDVHAYYVLAGATPVLVHNCGGRTNYMGADDPFAVAHADAEPLEGFHDVVIHGTPNSVTPTQSGSPHYSHRWLASRLSRDPSYPGGDIRLCSCSTGSPDGSFAQNLANKMGVNVLAPKHTLWAFSGGNLWVGPSRFRLSRSPDMWTLFTPGGGR
ncbi:RHS repeat-associated core domain-containing protein [Streptomyces sp. PA03-2a]|uniref:RHS repeat-associated core domain-containing protein n=1 Tax=Streptomyces sp. PA03-2a TaxID=3028701 RepID=UPI0029B1DEA4|nr:RHS repeat-associated core domain-containing protein [Streptomyces sp. PA03-2a]MDX2730989.1 polymorphic toxin-type HINT domain-containing protein [Streptomyces sp. PA03-2a]